MKTDHLLIVDDEQDMRSGLKRMLEREFTDLQITTSASGEEALDILQEQTVDIALIDIQMGGMDGLELLDCLITHDPWITVVIMTGFGTIEIAVDAIKRSAYDFITKPFDRDTIYRTIHKARERSHLLRENHALKQQVCDKADTSEFIGRSPVMAMFLGKLQTIARSNYTTLVRGESGTGKELAARAIHKFSRRQDKPLVMVNCPAIPVHLLESELFGHVRGAFTGASHDQPGLFAEADGGTICLDEVGDIPIEIQSKLLRVLQEQEIKPLGATRTKKIDVRVIALTNLDLEQMIADRLFREDLFYRLNVVNLTTPSLCELTDDIPLLINHFTHHVCCELDLAPKQFDQRALTTLAHRKWPGNVRQLQNVVRRAVMFCPHDTITIDDLPLIDHPPQASVPPSRHERSRPMEIPTSYKEAKEKILSDFTNRYIEQLLTKTGGNVTQAADIAGLSRAALQKILRKRAISASTYRLS